MPRIFIAGILLFLFLSFSASSCQAADPGFAVVDVARVMADSQAGHDGREHLQKVRDRLKKGLEDLKAAYSKSRASEREAIINDAIGKSRRQMALEEAAVNNVVTQILVKEAAAWRKANKAKIVIARQTVLDMDPALDITAQIITAMNKHKAVFPELPVVTIKQPNGQSGKGKSSR